MPRGRADQTVPDMQMQEFQMTPFLKDLATPLTPYLPESQSWALATKAERKEVVLREMLKDAKSENMWLMIYRL